MIHRGSALLFAAHQSNYYESLYAYKNM